MAPKEPTRAQLSSKLAYQANVPRFLQKLQNRMNGVTDASDDEGGGGNYDDEFEDVGNGREPIPRRPAIPERPEDNPGSGDEDDFADEKPQVVVLKEGKHLTEHEAENIRRVEKGLPPLPNPALGKPPADAKEGSEKGLASTSFKSAAQGLSFSSSSKHGTSFGKSNKRKATTQLDELKAQIDSKDKSKDKNTKSSSKKAKKASKTLLSFGDDT